MSAKKQTKHSNTPTIITKSKDKQKLFALDSIPKEIKDKVKKCAEEGKDILFEDMPFNDEIKKKQDALVELAYQVLIDPKKLYPSEFELAEKWFSLETINCLTLNNKEIHEEIIKFRLVDIPKEKIRKDRYLSIYNEIHSTPEKKKRYLHFEILYIKELKNFDDDMLTDISKLKEEIETKKWHRYPIENLTEDEIAKIKNGKKLYYDSEKQKITSKTEGDPVEIREIPIGGTTTPCNSVQESLKLFMEGEKKITKVYGKYISRKLIIISSFEKLPDWFQNKFELISLDIRVEINRSLRFLKYQDKEEELKPIELRLLDCLWEKKDTLTTRNEIYNKLWGNKAVEEDQITDHVSKLKKAFKNIGFEKEVEEELIIETKKERGKGIEGGYIFHSNIVSLDFH